MWPLKYIYPLKLLIMKYFSAAGGVFSGMTLFAKTRRYNELELKTFEKLFLWPIRYNAALRRVRKPL